MIKGLPAKAIVVVALMISAAALAEVAKPRVKLADQGPRIDLEMMVPKSFGEWSIDSRIVPVSISPDVQARLDKIYTQTLARTYVNDRGQRVMLSIAYGGDQSGESTQVHRPEFCYASQGFQVLKSQVAAIATRFGDLQVRTLVATQGPRHEPITYWVTVGDEQTLPGLGRKLAQLKYGFTGKVPDGMLVRVSSIDNNDAAAYALQQQFVQRMLSSMDDSARTKLIGVRNKPAT